MVVLIVLIVDVDGRSGRRMYQTCNVHTVTTLCCERRFHWQRAYTHCVESVVRISPMSARTYTLTSWVKCIRSLLMCPAKMKNERRQKNKTIKRQSTNVLCERCAIRNIDYSCCCCCCCCRSLTLILGACSASGVRARKRNENGAVIIHTNTKCASSAHICSCECVLVCIRIARVCVCVQSRTPHRPKNDKNTLARHWIFSIFFLFFYFVDVRFCGVRVRPFCFSVSFHSFFSRRQSTL